MMRTCALDARAAALLAAAALLIPIQLAAQAGAPIGDVVFDSSYFAWQRGEYIDALTRLDRLLNGPDGHRWLEPAAVLTGESFVTSELTTNGIEPRWSPDGQYIAWESGARADRRTHIARTTSGGAEPVATLNGAFAAFDGAGRVYFITVSESTELAQARTVLDAAVARRDNEEVFRARSLVSQLESANAHLLAHDVATGTEAAVELNGIVPQSVVFRDGDPTPYVLGAAADAGETNHLYRVGGATLEQVTTADGPKRDFAFLPGNRLLYMIDRRSFAIQDLATGTVSTYDGSQVTRSHDGAVAFLREDAGDNIITVLRADGSSSDVVRTDEPLANPSLSPTASRLVYQRMPREDWELFVVNTDGTNEQRITREIQHDLLPQFIGEDRVLAVMGEARHRRSYLYELDTGRRTRLFHNNTVRTVAPEYDWVLSPDGSRVLVVAERDGDTVSPERGIYLMDLAGRVTLEDIQSRVRGQLAAEHALRDRARVLFAGIEDLARDAVRDVSVERIYRYAHDLFEFDSKHITQPGNARAIEYIVAKLREFGYEPELQWFEARGVRTANIIAKLPGDAQPDVLYTVSSHFDSVQRGPGADDNTSGTSALLEAARVLAKRPQPATIHFAFFTGEEAGLLGSREYVRRAVANGDRLVGALNNDMVGFANDERLDNTIRYSNDGIRDIQHGAAMLFTDLITYDAKYYKSTDAHAYYEAYGDIVGGIGSYPILGNPHYHQSHDHLETINQRLVAEVSKTTVATLVKLTNSPSRVTNVVALRSSGSVDVTWDALPERDLTGYVVEWGPVDGPVRGRMKVDVPSANITDIAEGDEIRVSGINAREVLSWDAARVIVK